MAYVDTGLLGRMGTQLNPNSMRNFRMGMQDAQVAQDRQLAEQERNRLGDFRESMALVAGRDYEDPKMREQEIGVELAGYDPMKYASMFGPQKQAGVDYSGAEPVLKNLSDIASDHRSKISRLIGSAPDSDNTSLIADLLNLEDKYYSTKAQLSQFGKIPSHMIAPIKDTNSAIQNAQRQDLHKQLGDVKLKVANIGLKAAQATAEPDLIKAKAESVVAEDKAREAKEGTPEEKRFVNTVKGLIKQDELIRNNTNLSEVAKSKVLPSRIGTAGSQFAETILREKSGAAIGIVEEASDKSRYLPSVQDFYDKQILQDKADYRQNLINQFIALAGDAWKNGDYSPRFPAYTGGSQPSSTNGNYMGGQPSDAKARAEAIRKKLLGGK